MILVQKKSERAILIAFKIVSLDESDSEKLNNVYLYMKHGFWFLFIDTLLRDLIAVSMFYFDSNVLMYQNLAIGKVKRMFRTQLILIRPGKVELAQR